MAQQLNAKTTLIQECVDRLEAGYRQVFKFRAQDHATTIREIAKAALEAISQGNAAYHNIEHTVIVALVGQEILRGKHRLEETVSPEDWLHVMVSLLCHDIGYVRGVCHEDNLTQRLFATGVQAETVRLGAGATDASLAPYHVNRGKLFLEEQFGHHHLLDVERLKLNVELTRFPIPQDALHLDTSQYPGLVRAADLIGQLSDISYLDKIPALFEEMVETDAHKVFHLNSAEEMRAKYPRFYHEIVSPCIQDGLVYLGMTPIGVKVISRLYANVAIVEHEQLKNRIVVAA
jgi:hypothetical protein